MKKDPIKKAERYLESGNRNLQLILTHLNKLKKLNACLSEHLPTEIANYCQITNIIHHRLIIVAANASIATHIRFHASDLLKQFASIPELKMIQKIECKVRLLSNHAPSNTLREYQNMSLLSKKTADLVNEIANSISDPKLREIMQRIAKRQEKTNLINREC